MVQERELLIKSLVNFGHSTIELPENNYNIGFDIFGICQPHAYFLAGLGCGLVKNNIFVSSQNLCKIGLRYFVI